MPGTEGAGAMESLQLAWGTANSPGGKLLGEGAAPTVRRAAKSGTGPNPAGPSHHAEESGFYSTAVENE